MDIQRSVERRRDDRYLGIITERNVFQFPWISIGEIKSSQKRGTAEGREMVYVWKTGRIRITGGKAGLARIYR